MASTGKKGKKNKGKTLALTDFLATTKRSWSDEVEEAERLIEFNRKPALPAAPRAVRAIDESLIPKNPPYVAYLSNLSFEVDEKDISDVFADLNISSVRLPREEHTERSKGFGYVVFNDKLSFINALHMYEVNIKGRRVRIDIADQEGDRRRGGQKGGRENRESNYDSERSTGDWRSSLRPEYSMNDKRGSSNRRDYSFRDKEGFKERDRDRDRDRDAGDRSRGFGERETSWRDSERRFSSERDREYRSGFGGGLRRNYDDRNVGSNAPEPKTRPRLILNPRTKPLEEPVAKEETKKEPAASIFGQAKPVDTAAREREIEERLARERGLSKNDSDADRPRPRNDEYNESRRENPVPEPREKAWSKSSQKYDQDESSTQDIKNGQVSDSEEAPSNQENDRSSNRSGTAGEEPDKIDYKNDKDGENDKSDGEGRYDRPNRSESRYNEKNRESDRSYRRDDKYRGDDRDRRDRDRRDYERRDRGYDSEGRGRDSGGKYREQDREKERERDRDRDGDKRYNDRDIDNRRYSEKEPEGRKYSSDRDGDSKRYPEREGGRHREQDDHGSSRTQRSGGDKRGSASGDRGTRQGGGGGGGGGGRGAPEKERGPPVKDKPKEPKKPDDAPRMPKFKEAAAPNYVGTNKYCWLEEDGASE